MAESKRSSGGNRSLRDKNKNQSGSKKGCMGLGAILAVILIVIAVVVVYIGRGGSAPGFSGDSSGGSCESFNGEKIVVKVIAGSEKKSFFEDKEVQKVLASHGYTVEVKTADSRRMAVDVNLDSSNMAFPSSIPAVEKTAEKMSGAERYDVFYTPMATTTFDNILQALKRENVARKQGTTWQVDMAALAMMQHDNIRWCDFAENDCPSPRTMQISTTDIRLSNSAAMYLSPMSWIINEGRIVSGNGQVNAVLLELAPSLTGQGHTEFSSAGPFSGYPSQGVGSKPMVMVYELQFLGEGGAQNSRLKSEMRLVYLSSTILSTHVTLGFNDNGAVIARLLTEDPGLQKLTAKYGYRSSQPEAMEESQTQLKTGQEVSIDSVDPIDPPGSDILEQLIEGVLRGYQGPPRPETEEG